MEPMKTYPDLPQPFHAIFSSTHSDEINLRRMNLYKIWEYRVRTRMAEERYKIHMGIDVDTHTSAQISNDK
jgi:hypothetical protein